MFDFFGLYIYYIRTYTFIYIKNEGCWFRNTEVKCDMVNQ